MNKLWFVLPIFILLISCIGHGQTAEKLILHNGCSPCHSPTINGIGPSYQEISKKYRNQEDSKKILNASIKKGSKGKWPKIAKGAPMAGYGIVLSDDEIEKIVDWILEQ